MKKHATALRAFSHADDTFANRQVILGMDPGQFIDWRDAGLVREATDAEVAREQGTKEPTASKPKAKRTPKAKPVTKAPVADRVIEPPLPPVEPSADA
jgi:hypothetical protein